MRAETTARTTHRTHRAPRPPFRRAPEKRRQHTNPCTRDGEYIRNPTISRPGDYTVHAAQSLPQNLSDDAPRKRDLSAVLSRLSVVLTPPPTRWIHAASKTPAADHACGIGGRSNSFRRSITVFVLIKKSFLEPMFRSLRRLPPRAIAILSIM